MDWIDFHAGATRASGTLTRVEPTVWINWIAIVLASIVLVCTLALGIGSSLLRHQSPSADGPFSLARTQLLWWTDIIAVCLLLNLARTGTPPEVNATCLVVLGIGIATAAVATLIDAWQRKQRTSLPAREPHSLSRGFLRDILSGTAGLGVHRLQLVIFEVVYGVSFLTLYVKREFALPTFGPSSLMLLGFSSSGYLVLKALERGACACDPGCTGRH